MTTKPNAIKGQSSKWVRVRRHRDLPGGKLKNIILLRLPSGWYVLLQMELPKHPVEKSANPTVGVDMAISHALAVSDGVIFNSPQHLQASLRDLRVLQRSLSRKKKGSSNRRKAVQKVDRLHEKIANQRLDWWHKITRHLADTYGAIALEDLSLKLMLQNGYLSRTAHDVGLGMFRTMLDYKAVEAGVEIITVPPRNTSQACSGCGTMVLKDLSIRVHHCPDCGLTLDRDVNAARNILSLGRRDWALTWMDASCVTQDAPPL